MSEFNATHVAPDGGLRAWTAPDPTQQPVTTIQARVEMQVLELLGEWAHIQCNNGWSAWVDARKLQTKHAPVAPPAAAQPAVAARPAVSVSVHATGLAAFLARPVMTVGDKSLVVQDLIPAGGIIVGTLLSWLRLKGLSTSNSFDLPLLFLLDFKTKSRALKLGWLLLLAAVATVAPLEKRFHQIALGVVTGACVVYVIQLQRLVSSAGGGVSITDVLGIGPIVTLAAAGVGLYWSMRTTS